MNGYVEAAYLITFGSVGSYTLWILYKSRSVRKLAQQLRLDSIQESKS